MLLDIVDAVFEVAVTAGEVSNEQVLDERLGIPEFNQYYLSKSLGNLILPLRIFW